MHGAPRPGPEQDPGGLRAAGRGGQSSGTALPGKQACLTCFLSTYCVPGPGVTQRRRLTGPCSSGLLADTVGFPKHAVASESSECCTDNSTEWPAGGCHGQVVKEGLLEEVASGWRPAQCWAVQGPHHCSTTWPCCPSALTPCSRRDWAEVSPSLGAARATNREHALVWQVMQKKTSGRATRAGGLHPAQQALATAGTRAQGGSSRGHQRLGTSRGKGSELGRTCHT